MAELEELAAYVALEGGFLCVGEPVERQVRLQLERLLTEITLEGLLISMKRFVFPQSPDVEEGFIALITFEQPLTLVHLKHVPAHYRRLQKHPVTVRTLDLLHLGMHVLDVCAQTGFVTSRVPAALPATFERSLAGVDALVDLKRERHAERLVAEAALVWLLSRVGHVVGSHLCRVMEALVTNRTLVRPLIVAVHP